MILFEKGIGRLKNISYSEFKAIVNNLPIDWGYSFEVIYESPVSYNHNKYNVKLFRKKTL